jgi:hypothetical protein
MMALAETYLGGEHLLEAFRQYLDRPGLTPAARR